MFADTALTALTASCGPSTLTAFTASDGENLAVQDWPLRAADARATVLIVHGLGEHVGRYDVLARLLNSWGYAVRGYDHYGHGKSSGPRGGLTCGLRLVDDLADVAQATRARMPPGQPLVLLGHSMGGLVAALHVARVQEQEPQATGAVDALVLSSPAFDAGLNLFQKLLLATLPRIAPNLRVGNGLQVDALSHDPAVVAAYRADAHCHDRISARLARFIADGGPTVRARAARWQVPTLLLWAGQDRLVNPAGSQAFAQRAPAAVVQSQCFDALHHELFNEPDAGAVFAVLQQWLAARTQSGVAANDTTT
ncbi:MAG: alpha/beta hydrolase [Comamonadaceae bacterium]|nr:MAG: alpha/beta hydrolase [Comamonadaceae bacterium]